MLWEWTGVITDMTYLDFDSAGLGAAVSLYLQLLSSTHLSNKVGGVPKVKVQVSRYSK